MNIKSTAKNWWAKAGIDPGVYIGSDPGRAEAAARAGFAAKAKRHLGQIPGAKQVVAMYFCMLDPATPAWVKGVVAAALAYFILPLDAIPDFLPMVGLGDDAGVLAAAFTTVSSYVTDEHHEKARAWIADEMPGVKAAATVRA
ncbi:YkvA family protein [Tundrisphaera sp. TA3]|uniref:YkvA family protein n=1 Tax=Tundrisphaera sp. TA3 TaxID=3435775 RepID=UPI003EB9A026